MEQGRPCLPRRSPHYIEDKTCCKGWVNRNGSWALIHFSGTRRVTKTARDRAYLSVITSAHDVWLSDCHHDCTWLWLSGSDRKLAPCKCEQGLTCLPRSYKSCQQSASWSLFAEGRLWLMFNGSSLWNRALNHHSAVSQSTVIIPSL